MRSLWWKIPSLTNPPPPRLAFEAISDRPLLIYNFLRSHQLLLQVLWVDLGRADMDFLRLTEVSEWDLKDELNVGEVEKWGSMLKSKEEVLIHRSLSMAKFHFHAKKLWESTPVAREKGCQSWTPFSFEENPEVRTYHQTHWNSSTFPTSTDVFSRI